MLRVLLSLIFSSLFLSCSNNPEPKIVEFNPENLAFQTIRKNVHLFFKNEKIVLPPNSSIIFWSDFDCASCIKESYFNRIEEIEDNLVVITPSNKLINALKKEFIEIKIVKINKSKLEDFKLNFRSPVLVKLKSINDFVVEDL